MERKDIALACENVGSYYADVFLGFLVELQEKWGENKLEKYLRTKEFDTIIKDFEVYLKEKDDNK